MTWRTSQVHRGRVSRSRCWNQCVAEQLTWMLTKVLTTLKYQAKDHSTNQETLTELNKNQMNLHDLRRYLQALDRSQSQHHPVCQHRDRQTQHNEHTNQ